MHALGTLPSRVHAHRGHLTLLVILLVATYFVAAFAGQALRARDFPLLMGCTLVGALIVMASNLIVDLLYGVMDPRVRLTRR